MSVGLLADIQIEFEIETPRRNIDVALFAFRPWRNEYLELDSRPIS
ncbi:hypothetical protein AS9A_2623 [Hoyosella subflava DQS3-9A1]|uniref:Uncharacterized protein n=1 Tax=Hoyosella subflava (strain DSM 45089 / JCM 17490 / NBRC 109087 / DQS3-9A1) TaxID=443218 RepID=F6EGL7_HOYSD|nr:hypothetical protein AS9A_2623 [Hoyosella subflava DQS3-9A1]